MSIMERYITENAQKEVDKLNRTAADIGKAVRETKDKDIKEAAEKTATPIVEAVESLTDTVKEFDEISSILSLKMTKTIERFEASSSKLAKHMIILTGVIAVLTVVMILIIIFGNN